MPSPEAADTPAGITPGTLVGGRFSIERPVGSDALGETLIARDEKTSKPIAVRLLAPAFASDPRAFEVIRTEIRAAAKLKHRSIVGTYGIGTHGDRHFIACEWVQGTRLSELAAKRQGTAPLSLRGSYNVVAHVCKALEQVHAGERPGSCHGALRPSVVWVARSGRVKVGDLGLGSALVQIGALRLLDANDQAFLAPEVLAMSRATPSSDVYGVGALLYLLLTGRAPGQPLVPPSHAHPDATPQLDAIVARCLAPDPQARYPRVADVMAALLPLVAEAPASDTLEFGVDLEIDVDVAMSLRPAPLAGGAAVTVPKPAALPSVARDPFAPSDPFAPRVQASPPPAAAAAAVPAPAVPERKSQPKAPPAPAAPPPPAPAEVLASAMNKLTENDAPRWMAVKDGLDHGPFTARELIKLILEGQILEQHSLLNMSSGDRKPLSEYEEFREFVEQYKLHKADADHAIALEKTTRTERRGNAAKFVFLAGLVVAILGGGGAYLMNRRAAEKRQAEHEVDLAAMFESGRVKISGTAGILKPLPRKAGGGPAHSGGGDRSTGFTSYEDAMNVAMELGDATKGGGERQLRTADIEAVMNRRLNTLFGCVGQELRSGGHLGTVQIDMAILGSGQVAGASINTGSGAFKKCLAAKVRQISFPSFPAPRMGARYSFGVD
jgi:serine/threonine-protein kinase